jgi:hypothetical protein
VRHRLRLPLSQLHLLPGPWRIGCLNGELTLLLAQLRCEGKGTHCWGTLPSNWICFCFQGSSFFKIVSAPWRPSLVVLHNLSPLFPT